MRVLAPGALVRLVMVASAVVALAAVAAGCAVGGAEAEPTVVRSPAAPTTGVAVEGSPRAPAPPEPRRTPPGPTPSDGRPRDAVLSVPAIGVRDVRVVTYRGLTDDAAGTDIQDRGVTANPTDPGSGTGAGGVGNFLVTGHRNTAGGVFADLPDLERGDRVRVVAGGTVYVYEVRQTRETSFRSARSLREQRAPVPGRPGVAATLAMITLSTCATQEDHAAGNHWSDENDNPEHRIDKVGVLVSTRPAS